MSITQPTASEAWKIRIAPRTARDWDRANAQRIGQLARAQRAADLRAATRATLDARARAASIAERARIAKARRARLVDIAEDSVLAVSLCALVLGACVLLAAVSGVAS